MRGWRLAGLLVTVGIAGAALGAGCAKDDEPAPAAGGEYCETEPAGSERNRDLGCDLRCPGGPTCPAGGDPTFHAGAAVEDITPVVDHVVITSPRDRDRHIFKPLVGDKCVKIEGCDFENPASCPAVDPMRCHWMAGFGAGRFATGVADPATVRCVVMRQGETKVGLCAVDAVGYFYSEVQRLRELLAAEYEDLADLDFVAVGATHVHDMVDTMGQYGPAGASGIKPEYMELIRRRTAEALRRANRELRPVTLEFGKSVVDGHIPETDPGGHGAAAFVSDVRDPVVIDNELRTVRFVARESGETVATLLNFCSHPEVADSSNQRLSSDYVHTLRLAVEQGLDVKASDGRTLYRKPGVGGVAVFFNGALGGQVGPGVIRYVDFEGREVTDDIERAYNNGRLLGAYALEALTVGQERMETAPLGIRAREIYGLVENVQFHIAIAQQLFDRDGEHYDRSIPLGEDNLPSIRTQVFVLDVGPAEFVSIPGEVHAELVLTTQSGALATEAPYAFTPAPFHVINTPGRNPSCEWRADDPSRCTCSDGYSYCNPAPPDISLLRREEVIGTYRDPKARYRWVLGLTPDELGYIVPDYDYKLDPQNPYLEEYSPGDHYEETNGIGSRSQRDLVEPILQLLRTPPVVRR